MLPSLLCLMLFSAGPKPAKVNLGGTQSQSSPFSIKSPTLRTMKPCQPPQQRPGPSTPAPELPPDVLQRNFALTEPYGLTVLPLEERLRCQLVSKGWRAALDARTFPIPKLALAVGSDYASYEERARALAMAEWACRVRPRVEDARLVMSFQPSSPQAQAAHQALLSLQVHTVAGCSRQPCNAGGIAACARLRRGMLTVSAMGPQPAGSLTPPPGRGWLCM